MQPNRLLAGRARARALTGPHLSRALAEVTRARAQHSRPAGQAAAQSSASKRINSHSSAGNHFGLGGECFV